MWNVVGHEKTIEALRAAISAENLPHALLLVGAGGIGKTTLALELAKSLNCTGADPPCQQCVHCHQIQVRSHPDVTVVERQPGRDNITIQQVRELRDAASLRPFQGARKVSIIAGAESLTLQAADALLKTLEEPPPTVTFALTASDLDGLPATIISRCRVLALRSPSQEQIASHLAPGVGAEQARHIAVLARGNVGWAIQASSQPRLAAEQEEALARIAAVLDLDLAARSRLAEDLTAERKDRAQVRRSLELMLLLARDLLLTEQDLPPQTVSGELGATIRRQSECLTLAQLSDLMGRIRVAMDRIDHNVDPRLSLEALLMTAP
jgi:DNA polymerase-3 subunit delta'